MEENLVLKLIGLIRNDKEKLFKEIFHLLVQFSSSKKTKDTLNKNLQTKSLRKNSKKLV